MRSSPASYTDPVKSNFTLTLEADLLRAARKVAIDRNTSVNQLVREYLTQLARGSDRQSKAIEAIQDVFLTSRYMMGLETWTRGDLYDRGS